MIFMMYIDQDQGYGLSVVHGGGEFALPDEQHPVNLPDDLNVNLTPDHINDLVAFFGRPEWDWLCLPLQGVRRVRGLFGRVDLGGHWSPWVVGDDLEDVMEQLDDLYGVYEDYL